MKTMLFLVSVLGAYVGICSACSCFTSTGPDTYCSYDVVFRGTVEAEYLERNEPLDPSDPFSVYSQFNEYVYTVRVNQTIMVPEGLESGTIELRTPTQGSLCGTRFPVDVDAIFAARLNHEGKLETGLCEPNVPWDTLSDWDKELMTDHIADYCASRQKEGQIEPVSPPETPIFK